MAEPALLRVDMHVHTRASHDSLNDPDGILAAMDAKGIHRVVLTDHDELDLALRLQARAPDRVIAGEEVRLRRIVADRGLDEDEARRMIAAQMPAELKRARADIAIENTGTLGDLQDAARDVWRQLVRRAEERG